MTATLETLPQQPATNPNDLLTEDEAAALLGLKPQTLCVWRSAGRYQLPFLKVGRLVRYRRKELEQWIESRLRGG